MIRQTKEGYWVIDSDTHHTKWIEETGRLDHDFFTIPIACEQIPEGGVVIDCGSHVGSHAIAYSQKIGKKGVIICIEPGDNAYKALTMNAAKFQCGVMLMNVSAGNDHGSWADFIEDNQNFGASEVRPFEGKGKKVWTASIDGIMHDAGLMRLDFMKIDCEGCEPFILEGGKEAIKRYKPKLLIEVNEYKLKNHGTNAEEIYSFLTKNDYTWKILQPELTVKSDQYDILCKPL